VGLCLLVSKLKKVLPTGMAFPYDFGFVPSTEAEDGDPIDVLVLMDEPAFPGCVLKCRPIGVIEGQESDKKKKKKKNHWLGHFRAAGLEDPTRSCSLARSHRGHVGVDGIVSGALANS
jgi:hypothetical protein